MVTALLQMFIVYSCVNVLVGCLAVAHQFILHLLPLMPTVVIWVQP